MKVKELMAELSKMDPDTEMYVGVYDCGGFNDIYGFEVGSVDDTGSPWVKLEISVGCDSHRKWAAEGRCPIELLKKESDKIEGLVSSLAYHKKQFEQLEAQFTKRLEKK